MSKQMCSVLVCAMRSGKKDLTWQHFNFNSVCFLVVLVIFITCITPEQYVTVASCNKTFQVA